MVPPMRPALPVLLLLALSAPAHAVMRGKVASDPNGVRSAAVRVESSRGELCSGAVIAPDLVLTAAHCVTEAVAYRVVAVDQGFRPTVVRAIAVATHPAFVPGTTPRTQPGVDLAILRLEAPLGPDFRPLDPRGATTVGPGEAVAIAGFGLSDGRGTRSARTLRQANLLALGTLQVANQVMVVVDGERLAERPGAGACRGDSGGPVFRGGGAGGYQLLGIISWSSGAMNADRSACGGITAVTPVAEHASWIARRSAELRRLGPGQLVLPAAGAGAVTDWAAR
jgi:hypothetical protein